MNCPVFPKRGSPAPNPLDFKEQRENICLPFHVNTPGKPDMSQPSSVSDLNCYDRACEQAIAMCDGNPLSTIKALILANEYLETELRQWQLLARDHRASAGLSRTNCDAA
jgi:hypothetical protein